VEKDPEPRQIDTLLDNLRRGVCLSEQYAGKGTGASDKSSQKQPCYPLTPQFELTFDDSTSDEAKASAKFHKAWPGWSTVSMIFKEPLPATTEVQDGAGSCQQKSFSI
jgi:hypothetical protein